MSLCTSKTGGTKKISFQKQYIFLFLKYPYKKLSISNCQAKTCKDKNNNYYYSFKTQLEG
jgi:hypothetical protein